MALYELTTNAVKYGALSNESGKVEITWGIGQEGDVATFHLSWNERGGPIPEQRSHKGFGSRITTIHLEAVLGATTTSDLQHAGLAWSMSAPVGNVLTSTEITAKTPVREFVPETFVDPDAAAAQG